MADQLRADALGCYGNSLVRTPNLDALARDGARFTNCWAQHPVCMPSRASIFTGRYRRNHGVRSNGVPLPRWETTLAQVFLRNGYRTGGAGKFHFIPHYNQQLPLMENHPDPFYGFEVFHIGEDGRRGEHREWIRRYHPEYDDKPDSEIPLELHNSYWSASHTIEFIRGCVSRGQPFFAFCSFVDPHHPYDPPPPYSQMYREQDVPEPLVRPGEHQGKPAHIQAQLQQSARWCEHVKHHRAQYHGEVTFIDDSIGRILKALDEFGVRENTLIVFTADHGDMLGDHSLFFKGFLHYRACANLPLIINWPKKVKPGQVIDGLVQEIDIFPTICELAGLPRTPGVQGRSQTPVLTGQSQDTGYEAVLIEHAIRGENAPGKNLTDTPDVFTIRTQQWRMSYYPGLDYGELYDLERDPDEFENRWRDPKLEDVWRKLRDQLLDILITTHDPLPVRIEPY